MILAAANTPACLILSPKTFLNHLACRINSCVSTMSDPTGATKPFDKQNKTGSHGSTNSAGLTSNLTAAFISREASICNFNPYC
ncbi:unnamed protein product [Rotaria socialis]|uniref:Uncharacterized protein n=1 Tax=Rotaria socialis TaxID=392032 RepID=A0A820VBX0_9BILA|nr:unnamed protein product [Rotaria socialis]